MGTYIGIVPNGDVGSPLDFLPSAGCDHEDSYKEYLNFEFSATSMLAARLLGIPTVPFLESSSKGSFSLKHLSSVVVDSDYENAVNTEGETLIPPTLLSFGKTFGADIESTFGLNVSVTTGKCCAKNSIFLTISNNSSQFLDAAGRPTLEGYSAEVTSNGIVIAGASPLGAWWGTRSILQQGVLDSNMELSLGSAADAPGWGIRGTFLDVGRHFYPPEFLIEICGYLSYFKQNTFHLHLSDSVSVNPDISYEQKLNLYSAFRLNTGDSALAGLVQLANESYTQADFEDIQQSCAARGVTIIPEIEAPGHALPITKWKPELALSTDFSLLNISNPETIPTMETIWSAVLPWFHSKTVHLGADEYTASKSEYNRYINNMQEYILANFSKKVRIWGTFPFDASAATNINKNVSIQHWEFFEANPYFSFIQNGYDVVNTDDAFYMVGKWSGSYPQYINTTRIFHGAPGGGPYAPNIFDTSNAANNPARDNPNVLGHMPALWNDFGPNSTSVIEAYWSLREGLPALGDKQWGGDLLMDEYESIIDRLRAAIPGQNLDRKVPSKTSTIFSYDFTNSKKAVDMSGNGYDGTIKGACVISGSILTLNQGCSVLTPLTSKGRNYTLSFSIKPTSNATGTLFSGSASSLLAGNGSTSNVMMITGGISYILNYTLPINVWTDVNLVAINNATYFVVKEDNSTEQVHEFTTTIGDYSNSFIWNNPMSIEAPIAEIGGGSFEGYLKSVVLKDGADAKYAADIMPLVIGVAPYT